MPALRAVAVGVVAAAALALAYALLSDDAGPLLPGRTLPEPPPPEVGFRLEQNQPNPFQESTVIIYRVPAEEHVRLHVYNTLGAPVVTLVDEVQPVGYHQVEWDGRDRNGNRLPGGVYFYQLSAGGRQELRRMVLLP